MAGFDGDACGQELFDAFGLDSSSLTQVEKDTALANFKILSNTMLNHIATNGIVKVNLDNTDVDNEGAGGSKIGQVDNATDIDGTIE